MSNLIVRYAMGMMAGLILVAAHYTFGLQCRTVMHSPLLAMAMGFFMGLAIQLDAIRQGHQA